MHHLEETSARQAMFAHQQEFGNLETRDLFAPYHWLSVRQPLLSQRNV
jgi:hypothetical protein